MLKVYDWPSHDDDFSDSLFDSLTRSVFYDVSTFDDSVTNDLD